MTIAGTVWANLGWLGVLVGIFAVPLTLAQFDALTYAGSLLMWALPVAYLTPLFRSITADGTGRRRRAVVWTILAIAGLGVILDFLFGHAVLVFGPCPPADSMYLLCLPAVSGEIPIEEIGFYVLGPWAIVLVYACADEIWLARYNPPDTLTKARLIQWSWPLAATAAVAAAALLGIWIATGRFPTYPAFLIAGAVLPSMALYRCISSFVNWPAFAVTTLYVIVTSIVWEVTLAIPAGWWGYNLHGTLNLPISVWSVPGNPFPIEAAFVWLAAPFTSVLIYEFAKAFFHHPAGTREALFG